MKKILLNQNVIFLTIITMIGFCLRYYHWNFNSHWLDELYSAVYSHPDKNISEVIKTTISDVHPPFYQMLLWAFYNIFGYSEFSGRFLSIISGTFSIPLCYLLYKEVFNENNAALIASIIISLNYSLIFYSQETRSYSLLVCLTLLSTLFFLKSTKANTWNLFYVATSMLLISTHFFGYLIVISHFVYYVCVCVDVRKINKRIMMQFIFISLAALPILFEIVRMIKIEKFWIPKPTQFFYYDFFSWSYGSSYLVFVAALFTLIAFLKLIRSKSSEKMIVLLCIVVPFTIAFLKSIISTPVLTHRNLLVIIPFMIMMFAYGISLIRNRNLQMGAVFLSIIFSLSTLVIEQQYYSRPTRQDWRSVAQYIIGNAKHNDKIISHHHWELFNVYFEWYIGVRKEIVPLRELKKSVQSMKSGDRLFIISGHAKDTLGLVLKEIPASQNFKIERPITSGTEFCIVVTKSI